MKYLEELNKDRDSFWLGIAIGSLVTLLILLPLMG
jgi:hypothetical protein